MTEDSQAPSDSQAPARGPLAGLRVLDLSRILAGPTCTQLLGDLGADIVKIERPGQGDDTRAWGPPYLCRADGSETTEAAYYLSCNRAKWSVCIDIAKPNGQALVTRLLADSDVLIENFKVDGLRQYGLAWDQVRDRHPGLIYCSITGFGQTGPYRNRAGYDFLIQGMGGIMSITGQPDGPPTKVGVGIADVMCGMYAATAILAALRHRDATGVGQHIDLALYDTQVAWLINAGLNYLTSGKTPQRLGNAHPNIAPYQDFPASDGAFILAVGNDAQYRRFCGFAGVPELAEDARFATNAARVRHRDVLAGLLAAVTVSQPRAHWLTGLEALGVPCGPINDIAQVFDDAQTLHRGMKITLPHAEAGSVSLIGNPIKLSETPVTYDRPPPLLGEQTETVLRDRLGLDDETLARLRADGVIA